MAHSLYRNQAYSATLSKKLSTANGFYDDVFAGPAKVGAPTFSSRVEDYCEIFGTSQASRGSSIPVLDLPIANEQEASIDVRSSKFDYSKIFCGFGDLDFAAVDEELLAEPKESDRTSSEEAWTPAEKGSPLEGSDVLNCSEENVACEAAYQSCDSVKQFNMSYHRTNQRSDESMNGTTRIAEFHAVPGYSYLVDGTGRDMSVPTILNDVKLDEDFSEGTEERKPCRGAMSHPPSCDADKQTSDGDANSQNGYDRNRSYSNDNLFNACEARTHSSKLQPPDPNKIKDDYNKSKDSKFKASACLVDDCSSTSSDEEIDPNSAAAASAAAVRKAIENARARIRIARKSMERKKAGLQGSGKFSFKDGLDLKKKWDSEGPAARSRCKEKVPQVTCERVDRTVPFFSGRERQNAIETGQVVPGSKSREKDVIVNETTEKMHEKNSQTQVDHGQEGVGQLEEAKLFYDQVDTHKSRAAALDFNLEDVENKMIEAIDPHEWQEEEMVETNLEVPTGKAKKMDISEEDHKREEIGNATRGAQERDANKLEAATAITMQEEIEKIFRIDLELQETEKIENEEELKGCQQQIKKEEIDIRGWIETKEIENVEELKKCQQPINREDEIYLQDWKADGTLQKGLEEKPNQVEDEQKPDEQEENERTTSEACGWAAHGFQPGEVCSREENEKKQKDAPVRNCMKELPKVLEKETMLTHDLEESEKLLQENHPWEGNENLKEAQNLEEIEDMLKEFYQLGENEKSKEAHEWEETETTQRETDVIEESGQIKVTQEAVRYDGKKNFEATNDASEQDQAKNLSGTHKINEVFTDEENRRTMEAYESFCEPKENVNELKRFGVETDLEEQGMPEEARLNLDALKNTEIKNSMNNGVETFFLDANDMDFDETGMNFRQEAAEHTKEPELSCNLEEHFKKLAPQSVENNKHVYETEVALDEEEDEVAYGERQWIENGKKIEAVFAGKEMNMEMDQKINSSQITGSKENAQDTLTIEEEETKETLQKEAEVEKEYLRRMNEENERERERERIVVERAIREARERAFAEAREKAEKAAAERATVGTRQKVMAGGGERLNKASRDKPLAEKASVEAKLKAERAAVERATAEARERALEKALSGKAASGAREQTETFAAAKKDPRYQGSGPSSNSRYSNHGGFDEVKDEATQRSKPMSDRHQRTVERVAKVLEEKNMRDLLAQKEQAERNRLAEALDGDVKRWSSGKEGNLRALLATLQYILGPDSGWQPIPLTDIITTNAIKKAYRKATLCVHPDKLQQRGATIQQKYICEKVFDLLQEAWNKFNSEDR